MFTLVSIVKRHELASLLLPVLLFPLALPGQAKDPLLVVPVSRVLRPVDEAQRITLTGSRLTLPSTARDLGAAPGGMAMEKMVLLLAPDAAQSAAAEALAALQQQPGSHYFRHWLTPQSYGEHFGLSQNDRRRVTDWLIGHGFQIDELSDGGRTLVFSGTVAQVEETLHTRIHIHELRGERHYTNDSELQVPAALGGVIGGLLSLHDFYSAPAWAPSEAAQPAITPAGFANLYNAGPLYSSGITGAQITVAVAARTQVELADVARFRDMFNLRAGEPEVVLNGSDPGRRGAAEEAEALLDLEWSGALAPAAKLQLVVSASTDASDGALLSAHSIVERNEAAVMLVNFTVCEPALDGAAREFVHALWLQAALQGISVVSPATCAGGAINALAATPYNLSSSGAVPRGGESLLYPRPWWQTAAGADTGAGRAVPDLAFAPAEAGGYAIVSSGGIGAVGGDSPAASALAGLMALLVQGSGVRLGNPAPALYALAAVQPNALLTAAGTPQAGTTHRPGYGLGALDAYEAFRAWERAATAAQVPPPMVASGERSSDPITEGFLAMAHNGGGWGTRLTRAFAPAALVLASMTAASVGGSTPAGALKPVLFYSDLDSGPASGGENASDGAFVCVYGENFGAARQDSTLKAGGVEVASYKVWSDPGAPYRPGYYAKACGTINHRSAAGATTLQLTTAQGASNSLSFTIRPGKVYFVAATGSDKTGNGSSAQPWLSFKRCRSAMAAGDICYVRGGNYTTRDIGGAVLALDSSGAPGLPKAIVAYPGESVVLDNRATGSNAAVITHVNSGSYQNGARIAYWTLAGLSINGAGMAVQLYPFNSVRLVDNEIQCQGGYCWNADAGLLAGHPAGVSSGAAVLGNRIHDVGCHEDADYKSSAHPCNWISAGSSRITSQGSSWSIPLPPSSFNSGTVIQAGGQMRRVSCATAACRNGTLDAPFANDLTAAAFQLRFQIPTKLFHTVYFGNTNSVQFAWNDVDGGAGQACRGVQFHSTNGHNEFDLHVFSNAIHDTVCDCLNFATVDPSQGTVEAYNNVLYNCGKASPTLTASSYSAIYDSNTNDDYAETMTRKGNIQLYNNTIYNAGNGAGLYNRACFALQTSGDITGNFAHASLTAPLQPGSSVTAQITGLCGYGSACIAGHSPVPFLAGQLAVLDSGHQMEEVSVAAVPDGAHVVLSGVRLAHAAGARLTAANGNAGMTLTNNLCVQTASHTSYLSLLGSDEASRPAASYLSGSNNGCSGLASSGCPAPLKQSLGTAPRFVAPAQQNFRLMPASPVRGAGIAPEPATDQDGAPRPSQPTPGAFEAPVQ